MLALSSVLRGRPIKLSSNEHLKKFYELSSSDESGDEEASDDDDQSSIVEQEAARSGSKEVELRHDEEAFGSKDAKVGGSLPFPASFCLAIHFFKHGI